MRLTIYRGSHEIGGNCVELAAARSRIVIDAGLPLFGRNREPHDTGALRKLAAEELRTRGILPPVRGLFDDGPAPDALLLSHAHEDHTGLIGHSKPEIPIYASIGTSKMMKAGSLFAGQPDLPRERRRELLPGTGNRIGDFTVTPFPVDHSVYGSQAFLIEAEGKSVLYSGDLRLHGRRPEAHRKLIAAVRNRNIDALLMEGTHIGHAGRQGPTEFELEDEIAQHVRSAPGLVLASFSPQHVDRLVSFLNATKIAGRTFVADAYTAFVMHLIASETSIPRPESRDGVRVFFPRFYLDSPRPKRLARFHSRMAPVQIQMDEIRSDPGRFVMLFRPSMLESDFNGRLPPGASCLYSRWTGYLDRPDWQAVRKALAEAAGTLSEVHTSGHIHAADIARFVRDVGPKSVVPIHTFEPERFDAIHESVTILADGESWIVP